MSTRLPSTLRPQFILLFLILFITIIQGHKTSVSGTQTDQQYCTNTQLHFHSVESESICFRQASVSPLEANMNSPSPKK
jgi:hypothetical protein